MAGPTPFPSCRDCLAALAGSAAEMAAGDDSELAAVAKARGLRALAQALPTGLSSPELAGLVMREIRRATGVDDPYAEFKRQEMDLSRRTVERLAGRLPRDLMGLLDLAVLGNSLDFFRAADQAMDQVAQSLESGVAYHRDDRPRLARALEARPGLVLYLADNAGEVYFDLPLYEHLRGLARRVVYVVKAGPAQNDLTRSELESSGLAPRFEAADTGADGAGVDWRRIGPGFKALLHEADVILAKGMANFETMYQHPLPAPALFLFKAKCQPLQEHLRTPPDAFWALWQEASA
jgi:uncharacterized protein with ATP-grasp and redox domains